MTPAKKAAASRKSKVPSRSTQVGVRPPRPAKPVLAPSLGRRGAQRGAKAGRPQAERKLVRPKKPRIHFGSPKDIRILVVDDEPEVVNLLVPFLRAQGYTVSDAQDGDQALEKILTDRPNIVVLDVMMPGLSGWEISRYVRERAELDSVRIIMATGIGKETNAAMSPLYEADDYIDKPFRLEALNRTVKKVVARLEAGTY